MTVGRKSAYFYESTDANIIEQLVGDHGLKTEVEATNNTHQELVQYRASDWDFMITRAQANGKLCFIDDGLIKVAKPDLKAKAVETVAFGSSIHEFDGEIDARDQYSAITSYAWSPTDQELIEAEATDPAVKLNGDLSSSDLAEVIGAENVKLKHGGNLTKDELQDWSDAKMLYQQLARTRGRVKFQGIPQVKPGVTLNLEGVGNRFNGTIYVTGIRHEISGGNLA